MSISNPSIWTRRALLGAGGALAAGPALAMVPTLRQTEGPFYPDPRLIRASDADLTSVDGRGPAPGEVIDVAGRVLAADGSSVAGAAVEIWQADDMGRYRHPADGNRHDPAFQGFGAAIADGQGNWAFRTIRPAPYDWRTPHIHFKVRREGRDLLTTQMYFPGEALNAKDGIFRRLGAGGAAATAVIAPGPSAFGSGASVTYDWTIIIA